MTRLQLIYLVAAGAPHGLVFLPSEAHLAPGGDDVNFPPIIDHSPDAMTPRARTYIAAGGWRHFLVGATMLAFPWLYGAAAFIPIFNLISVTQWGIVTTLVGLICLGGSATRNGDVARVGIVGSAILTLVLAAGLAVGVSAVWVEWVNQVGWDEIVTLFRTHPKALPASLLIQGTTVPPSPFLPLVMCALTVKDFTMCAQPLRVPLEERAGAPIPRVS